MEEIKTILKIQSAVKLLGVLFLVIIFDVLMIKNPYISALILICGAFVSMLIFCYIIAKKID